MVFPAGTGSEFVISTPVSVALFNAAQRFDESDCAFAAIEHVMSTRVPISEYLIRIASQDVRARLPLLSWLRAPRLGSNYRSHSLMDGEEVSAPAQELSLLRMQP